MHILILDTKNHVVENVKRYKGTINSSVLRASEVFRPAIVRNCPNVIVCHNHPSGDPTPSPEDIEVTKQLVDAGATRLGCSASIAIVNDNQADKINGY